MHPSQRGRAAERLAAGYLELSGLCILDRNRRAGAGEVDLVAREGDCLVFVEVRLRGFGEWGGRGASIRPDKLRRLRDCARHLARAPQFRWPRRSLRLDVVIIEWGADSLRMWHHRRVRGAEGLPRRRPDR